MVSPGTPSSDATLRGYAPDCVREPYLRAVGARGFADRRLTFALGFVETALGYLTALLAPEGGRFGDVKPFERLRNGLDRPTLGVWAKAADGLAQKVLSMPQAVARPAALVLRDPNGKPTAAHRALERLISARNRLAHDSARPLDPTSPAARELYKSQVKPAIGDLFAAFTFVRDLPLFVADAPDREVGRVRRVYRLIGAESRVFEIDRPLDVRPLEPLLIDPAGRILELGPFLSVQCGEAGLRPVLLHRAPRAKPVFINPDGGAALTPSDAWLKRWFERKTPALPRTSEDADLARRVHAPGDASPGVTVSDAYRIHSPVARGASAVVYLAIDPDGEQVALRVLHQPLRVSHAHVRRLEREVQLLSRVRHPNVIRARLLCHDDCLGRVLVMDYAHGVDLARVFSDVPTHPRQAVEITLQILDALSALHAAQVVHRDVKPANVILHEGHVTLVDFGIARDEIGSGLTQTLDRLGTRAFAAPEQFTSAKVGPAADLFAVGRLLTWLLTAQRQDLRRGLRDLPAGLSGWVRRATRQAPEDRFPHADGMAAALRKLVSQGLDLGAPLAVGDAVLDGAWRVTGPLEPMGPGTWVAPVQEAATDDRGTLWCAQAASDGAASLREQVRKQRHGRRVVAEDDVGLYVAIYESAADASPEPAPPKPTATRTGTPADILAALPGVDRVLEESGHTVGYVAGISTPMVIVGRADSIEGRMAVNGFAIRALPWMARNGVRLLGVTDGERWRWCRRTGVRDLAEVYNPEKALAKLIAERRRLKLD